MITLSNLVPHQLVLVAGIPMCFFYWDGNNPVFYQKSNPGITYIKRDWTKETIIK
ncbi:MAG: hypothetical protein O9340_04315 [Cyclobacteriaceae bacterium]|nr:hypothetical protein [Cyclobacteriaceae bacterium]